MNDAGSIMFLLGVAYGLSIGFGMIFAQAKRARFAHRVWVKAILGTISFVLKTIGDLLYWLAKLMRK